MRVTVPVAIACVTILMLLLLTKLSSLQLAYTVYLDIAQIVTTYCTATSSSFNNFARCIKLIEPRLVPVSFQDCSRCYTSYNLQICYTCHMGMARTGSVTLNVTTYIAPTYIDAKRIVVRRGRLVQILYNITIIVVADTYTSLTLPKNCTYTITGQDYTIRCQLPKIKDLKICDVRGLCISIRTLG